MSDARKNVLLVEDEALLAMTEKMQLEKYGYSVRTVATGEKAVDVVKSASDIDVILMDINLGEGIDGTQAAEIILQDHDIPVVFVSSHTERGIVEKTEKITSYGYVVKSSSVTVLDASIKMAIKLFEAKKVSTNELNEREKVEEKLRESEEKYHSLFEQSTEGIYLHDLEGRILDANLIACTQSGYSREELLGITVFDCFPPESTTNLPRAEILKTWRQWKPGQKTVLEAEHKRKDGSIYPVEISTGVVRYGNENRILAIVKDITERKQAEKSITEKVTLLSRTEEIAHIGNWQLDLTSNTLHWSDGVYRIFGCAPQQFAATYEAFLEFVHPQDRVAVDKAYSRSLAEGREGYEIEHRVVRGDSGEIRYVYERCDHDRDDAGTIIRSTGIVQDITERKTMELTLSERNQYLKAILATTADGFWVVTPDRRISEVNAAYCRMSGYSAQELAALSINDLDALEDPQETAERIGRIMKHGSDTFETKHRRKDGSVFEVEVTASRFDRADGMCLVCFCRDITDRRRVQGELEESRDRYQLLVDRSPGIIYLFNTQSSYLFVSEAARRILGYDPEEIARDPTWWNGCVHWEDRPINERAVAGAIGGETYDIEYRMRNARGDWVWLRDRLMDRTERDGEIVLQGYAEDITEQKRYQQQLSEQNAFLDAVLDNMLDLVAVTDMEGVFLYAGRSHERLGYTASSLIGHNVMDFVHPDDRDHVMSEFSVFLQDKNERSVEYRYRCADGSYTWLETRGRLLREETGAPSRILFNTRDVSERRQMLADKDLLMREIQHRIKNNINTMASLLSLQAHNLTEPSAIAALHDARSRMNSLGVLYTHLYNTGDNEKSSLQEYLQHLVASEIEIFSLGPRPDIRLEIAECVCTARTLSTLGLLVNELLTNAMKYAFRDHPDPILAITGVHREETYLLTIADNGPGIPDLDEGQPASRTGLMIVHTLVGQLNGTIRFQNQNGTRVEIEVPIGVHT